MTNRIEWPKPYRARAPNGDVLKEDTQSEIEDAVDQHAAQHGHQQPYVIERDGRLEPEPENASSDGDE